MLLLLIDSKQEKQQEFYQTCSLGPHSCLGRCISLVAATFTPMMCWTQEVCCGARFLLIPSLKAKMALQQTARQFKAHFHSSNEIFSHQWKSGKEDSTLALSENHNSLTSHRHSCSGDPSMFSAQFLSMLTFKNMNCFWCHLCLIFKKIFFFSN